MFASSTAHNLEARHITRSECYKVATSTLTASDYRHHEGSSDPSVSDDEPDEKVTSVPLPAMSLEISTPGSPLVPPVCSLDNLSTQDKNVDIISTTTTPQGDDNNDIVTPVRAPERR